jgi:hypothetical protein
MVVREVGEDKPDSDDGIVNTDSSQQRVDYKEKLILTERAMGPIASPVQSPLQGGRTRAPRTSGTGRME